MLVIKDPTFVSVHPARCVCIDLLLPIKREQGKVEQQCQPVAVDEE